MQLTPAQFFKKLHDRLPELKKQALDIIEVEAENFVLENFQRGEFQDTSPQVWKKRSHEASPPYAPLVRTGDLKRAATTARREANAIRFVMNQPYAQVQNEGGRVPITARMRKFFWAKYYESGKTETFWLNLAITKKSTLNIPKRHFIGNSEVLNLRIKRKTTVKVAQFLKSL